MRIKVNENDIKKVVKDYLNILAMQGKCFHFPVLQGIGAFKGIPDRIVILPHGVTLWIEVKTMTGKLSKDQIEFQKKCEQFGHKYIVVRSLEDIIRQIKGEIKCL